MNKSSESMMAEKAALLKKIRKDRNDAICALKTLSGTHHNAYGKIDFNISDTTASVIITFFMNALDINDRAVMESKLAEKHREYMKGTMKEIWT